MTYKACFQCGVHTANRKQRLDCDHEIYEYHWKDDLPSKLDEKPVEKEDGEVKT